MSGHRVDSPDAILLLLCAQADERAPVRPGQAARDERGRVCLDDLADSDLDYGADAAGLAALRRRLHRAIGAYNGAAVLGSHTCEGLTIRNRAK
jgi:hypothetical protein